VESNPNVDFTVAVQYQCLFSCQVILTEAEYLLDLEDTNKKKLLDIFFGFCKLLVSCMFQRLKCLFQVALTLSKPAERSYRLRDATIQV
jgi:hypothetical protein